jgi:hypothetical protein
MLVNAVRVRGIAGGSEQFVTASELDVLTLAYLRTHRSWDINSDLRVDVDDLHEFNRAPYDLNEDGAVDGLDASELEHALRWREAELMFQGRR